MNPIENDLSDLKEKKDFSILYVEDEVMIRTPMYNLIRRMCSDVVVASDGVEGLTFYRERPFSIVVTDLQMPNMNGAELIKEIRSINPHQIIAIVTAYRDGDELRQAKEFGIDYILSKPISLPAFIEIMKKVASH